MRRLRQVVSLLLLATLVLAARPANAFVLAEDAFAETSTELGLMLRSFTFVFAGPVLRPPYNLEDANPSAAAITDLRLSFAHKTRRWSLVAAAQLTPRLSSQGTSLGGGSLGRGVPPPRWLPLRGTISEGSHFSLVGGFDWLYARVLLGPVTITLGRQPLTFGRGQLWHPTDLVSMFSLTEVDTEYKPGADVLRIDWQLSPRASLTLVAAGGELADDHDAELSWAGSSLLARFKLTLPRSEVGLMVGYVRGDAVFALDGTVDLKLLDLYGEVVVNVLGDESLTPNEQARCPLGVPLVSCDAAASSKVVSRAVVGVRFKPTTKLTTNFEAFYNGFGTFEQKRYIATALSERVAIGDVVALGRLYLGGTLSWEVHPLVRLSTVAIANLGDPSALWAVFGSYSVASNVEVIAGAYLPIGRLPDLSHTPIVVPRHEYGLYPTFFFFELKAAM